MVQNKNMFGKQLPTINPHQAPHWRLSKCCEALVNTIPACFGDPEITVCSICHRSCTVELKPVYEKMSPGVYRPINYKNKDKQHDNGNSKD